MTTGSKESSVKKKIKSMWLIYVSLILSGLILIGDAYNISHLSRWTARLGFALLFTALALVVANGRKIGYFAVAIVWLAVIVSYII